MFEDHNDTIYEIISGAGLLESKLLEEINESHLSTGKPLAEAAIDAGLISRGALLAAVASYLGCDYLEQVPGSVSAEVAAAVRDSVARMYGVMPFSVDDTSVSLLAKDPFNPSIIDDLTFTLNKDISIIVCDPDQLDPLMLRHLW